MNTISDLWMWLIFFALVGIILGIDIFLLSIKRDHRISSTEALCWTTVWIITALVFNLLLWLYLRHTSLISIANKKALEFFTGYLIEKSLSIDNIFVFLIIFRYFSIPAKYQRRVLLYGVLGAIFMRMILILFGIWLINKFDWILYLFGAFLLITGIRMFFFLKRKPDLGKNPILKWMRKNLRITEKISEEKFFVHHRKLIYVTPLFLVLVLVELSDLIFAIDSIPAVFAITRDPFIVFTSNIFAILGLRALYFLLADIAERFRLVKYGIALLLTFVGVKMLVTHWIKLPILFTLGIIITTIVMSILLSLFITSSRSSNRIR